MFGFSYVLYTQISNNMCSASARFHGLSHSHHQFQSVSGQYQSALLVSSSQAADSVSNGCNTHDSQNRLCSTQDTSASYIILVVRWGQNYFYEKMYTKNIISNVLYSLTCMRYTVICLRYVYDAYMYVRHI